MSDENFCEGDLRLLREFDCPEEELNAMSLSDKKDLIKTIRLSLNQNVTPVHENSATPTLGDYQNRLQNMGVSMTRVGAASRNDSGDQEIMILKEITGPGGSQLARTPIRSSLARPLVRSPSARPQIGSPLARSPARSPLARPPVRSPPAVNSINITSPMKTITPTASTSGMNTISPTASTSGLSSGIVGTRKKIDKSKSTKGQVVKPIRPESSIERKTTLSQDFRNPSFRAEIYALDPLSCINTELSTLAEASSVPRRKRTSVPFYYTEHALSLKTDDYVELCFRKFGCIRVPLTSDDVEKAMEVPEDFDTCNATDEPLDFPVIFEESSAKYNLRQRTANKRTAIADECMSDDYDSDSIIPSKKSNRNETDTTFTLKAEAKAPKSRASKLSLATNKIAAERLAKTSNDLAVIDSDDSNNSDVPGKEVYAPKLEYSAVVAKDKFKWKESKAKVSAQPKAQDKNDEILAAMSEMKVVKPRQTRAKPSDVLKPMPIAGKTRRAALTDGVPSRKPARGKHADKKSEKDDNEENEENEVQDNLVPCPICKEQFHKDEIVTHVNACCDDSATKIREGACPVCSKNFPLDELEDHCSLCEGSTENQAMDED